MQRKVHIGKTTQTKDRVINTARLEHLEFVMACLATITIHVLSGMPHCLQRHSSRKF